MPVTSTPVSEKARRSLGVLIAGAASVFVVGCVTINIYFPAAAAEKAADKIIDEVWQLQKQGQPAKP